MPKNDKENGNFFRFSYLKSFIAFVLVFGLSIPFVAKSQIIENDIENITATSSENTTIENIAAIGAIEAITIDVDNATSTGSTTPDTVPTVVLEIPAVATTTDEIATTTEPLPELDVLEPVTEPLEEPVIEPVEEIIPDTANVLPVRNFARSVVVDESAPHSCVVEDFKIDISGKSESHGRVIVAGIEKGKQYNLEIGGLPKGIDMQFTEDRGYFYELDRGDESVDFKIINHPGSRSGDFSVPVIFTKKGQTESSVICQVNILNI